MKRPSCRYHRLFGLVVLIGLAAVLTPAAAQTPAEAPAVTVAADTLPAAASVDPAEISRGKAPGKTDDGLPEFAEIAKDHKEVLGPQGEEGYYPLYYNKKDDQLLAVIPKRELDKNFLLASSIAAGPDLAGYMWQSGVFRWREFDKKLVLVAPDLRNTKKNKSEVADVVDRTYTDRIAAVVPIVARKGHDPVIDLGDLFKNNDFAELGRVYRGGVNGGLSRWVTHKAFPHNVEVEVDVALMRGDTGMRAGVHYSLVELPKNDYKPREADPRIGYFLTAIKDWSSDHDADTMFKRYIHRWDVRKAEPDRPVSDADPDHQIVYYIEKTVPVQYRRYVREGILEWNKAFEKAGIRNAIRVEQQTDTLHADKDPEDVRYAFFRWIVSGRAYAMGPSLANPLTGQILDADILFDDSMVRSYEVQFGRYTGTGLSLAEDPQLAAFYEANPEWRFISSYEKLLPETSALPGLSGEIDPEAYHEIAHQPGFCTFATGLTQQVALTMAHLDAIGHPEMRDEFMGQVIREVVTHEVGHTLGLRHNFKASSWKSVEDVLAIKDPNEPTCGSVMDYNPSLFNPDPEQQGLFMTQTVGPYDEWAIQYGYASPDGTEYKNEGELLKSIVARVAESGLAYATDDDTGTFAPDPLVNRFDYGDNLVEYAQHRIEMVRRLQKDIADWAVKDGDSYYKLRRVFDMLLGEYSRAMGFAVRYVGGQELSRAQKGDPDAPPPITIVPVEQQRAALRFVIDTALSDADFNFDPDLLNRLAAGRWSHWGSDAYDSQLDYPVHDRILSVQYRVLFQLLNPVVLNRVYDAELKVAADQDAFTVPELLKTVRQAVWSELEEFPGSGKFSNREPYVSSIRRNLQREHLRQMLNLALATPGAGVNADVHAVVCLQLQELSDALGAVLDHNKAKKLDDFTRAHFEQCKSRIDRALEAEYRL